MTFQYNDGGRADAGYKGKARDCGARAMAIALQINYKQAYNELAEANAKGKHGKGIKSARRGVYKDDFSRVLEAHGWIWMPAPKFDGRKARVYDMPAGRVIARMARHLVAVVDGVAQDTWNCTGKMVYGYWAKNN